MTHRRLLFALLAGMVLSLGLALSICRGPLHTLQPPQWFSDATSLLSPEFIHDAGGTGQYAMPQIMGSGGAVLDFDQDGRPDLLLLNNGGPAGQPNRLYRQARDGRFVDVSAGSGLDFAGFNMGAAVGDVNNDGWPDVLVTSVGAVRLLLNGGKGHFTDVTQECSLVNPSWGTSAAWVDFDRDGWLDLAVANYVDLDPSVRCTDRNGQPAFCPPLKFSGTSVRLFRNTTGESGGKLCFRDVTHAAGLDARPGRGLGLVALDWNGDGWPDVLVANDEEANALWINQRDGTFREEGMPRGLAVNSLGQVQANMGVALGDMTGDGRLDVFVTHLTEENHALWRQVRAGQFEDQTARFGLLQSAWHGTGFGTVLADFDHDGRLDLAIVNGRIAAPNAQPGFRWSDYHERNQLFRQDSLGRLVDVSSANPAFTATPGVSRGLLCADLDGDGALDLIVTRVAAPASVFLNRARRGHWLMVRALDPARRRDAYGAEIRVTAGGRIRLGVINPAYSYLSSNDWRAHFGLGEGEDYTAVEVRWPSGDREMFPGGPADRVITLKRGEGRPAE